MMMLRKIVNHPYLVKWEVDEAGDFALNETLSQQQQNYYLRLSHIFRGLSRQQGYDLRQW